MLLIYPCLFRKSHIAAGRTNNREPVGGVTLVTEQRKGILLMDGRGGRI